MDTCPLCQLRTDLNYHVCLHGIRKPVLLRPGQSTMGSHSSGFMAQSLSSPANINIMPTFLRFPLVPPTQAVPTAAPVHQMYNIINPSVSTCFLPTQHPPPFLISNFSYPSLSIVNNLFGSVASSSPGAMSQSSHSRSSLNETEPSTSKNISYSYEVQTHASAVSTDHIKQNYEIPSNVYNGNTSRGVDPLAVYYSQQNDVKRSSKKEYPTLKQYGPPASTFIFRDNSDSNEEALDLSDRSAQRSLASFSPPKESHSEAVTLNFIKGRESTLPHLQTEIVVTEAENIEIKGEPIEVILSVQEEEEEEEEVEVEVEVEEQVEVEVEEQVEVEVEVEEEELEEEPVNYGAGPSTSDYKYSSPPRNSNSPENTLQYDSAEDSDDEICSLESSDSEHDSVDITKKDLLATENLEDNDDDQYYADPLQPFVNLPPNQSAVPLNFYCRECFSNFPTHTQLSNHVCSHDKNSKQKDSSQITLPHFLKPSAPTQKPLKSEEIQQSNDTEIDLDSYLPLKIESTNQTALGSVGNGKWKCDKCYKNFLSSSDYSAHFSEIMSAQHKCLICHLIFKSKLEKIVHREEVHSVDPKTDDLDEELNENASGEYVCLKCDRAFTTKDLYTKHQSCHNEERPFECLQCGKKFAKLALLRNHQKTHFQAVAHKCFYCDKTFHAHSKLVEHERIHTGEAPLTCSTCGKSFKRHSNLSEHRRTHQTAKPKPLKELFCHCGKVFHNQRDLDWHKEGAHSKVPQKCKHCGEVFVHSSSLTRHIRLKHETSFVPTGKKASLYDDCPLCGKTFYKTSINKHIRIKHEGIKQYECGVCKMTFTTKSNLTNHAWQHKVARSRPFKCTLCTKAFLRQALLDSHLKMHRGIKSFTCNECGLQFANKSNLQRHVREHSGTRSFTCTVCSKKFARHYYLTDHMKTHTGERPYVCGICGKGAATRSNYNSHMQTHISREPMHPEI